MTCNIDTCHIHVAEKYSLHIIAELSIEAYVASGVDAGKRFEVLLDTSRSEMRKELLSRCLGRRRTCHVIDLGPPESPVRFID